MLTEARRQGLIFVLLGVLLGILLGRILAGL